MLNIHKTTLSGFIVNFNWLDEVRRGFSLRRPLGFSRRGHLHHRQRVFTILGRRAPGAVRQPLTVAPGAAAWIRSARRAARSSPWC